MHVHIGAVASQPRFARSSRSQRQAEPCSPTVADEMLLSAAERRARLAAQAARQWGNITSRQLAAHGYTRNEIAGLARRGELLRIHRGVYALGHQSPAPEGRWAAALLAAGNRAALSHTAAAAARRLMAPRHVTEVTAPTDRRGDERLHVHRALLSDGEVTVHAGLRIVSAPRMLLELAEAGWWIDKMTHQVVASGLADLEEMRRWAAAHPSAPGIVSLRAALDLPHTRSSGEIRLAAFLRRIAVGEFEMNARVGRLRVDALVPALGVAIELDPEQTHGSAHAQRTDAWRDRYLRARGLEPLRVEIDDLETLGTELRARA